MKADPLARRIAHGALWAFASSWARIVISLLAFAVIARAIGPANYGLNTGAGALVALFQVLVGPAAGEVIVQRQDLPPKTIAAYFWLLLATGIAIFAVLAGASSLIAAAFDAPLMAPVLMVYALTVPATALQTIPEASLSRDLQFHAQALAGGAGAIAGSAVGIGLALSGAGVWSLAALQLSQALVQAAVLWLASAWRPARAPAWNTLAPLLRYSSSSIGVRLLNEFDSQLPKVFIGHLLGVAALGYYGLARRVFDLLKDMLIVPLNMVALPSIAKARARGDELPRLFGAALRVSTFIANPAFLGLIAIAPLLIPAVFGAGWQPTVPALQLMALLGLRSAVNSFNGAVLRGFGRPLQQLGVAAFGVALLCVTVPLAAHYGLLAAIGAVVFRSYATWPIAALLVERLGVYPAKRQFTAGLRSLGAALPMAVAVYALSLLLTPALAPIAALCIAMPAGVALYALLSYLSAPRDFREGLETLRAILSKRVPAAASSPAT
ncbi:MAG: polysaccharide biosynthesis protein [Hydrocarboniphaga sp.]|uniref:lipopolysaccharide biosynthesis protein n=1 Tax=Hydrocarboniphaga sp. TaxID=2033016 RepID=UPI0026234941|nr:lipopolysaccharide biosynthesis protein [Hydrocarboniphaga sp.]MDB5971336.1 polysaccharide biosynthesis protein [Hydrocarboniphaga sp.]